MPVSRGIATCLGFAVLNYNISWDRIQSKGLMSQHYNQNGIPLRAHLEPNHT